MPTSCSVSKGPINTSWAKPSMHEQQQVEQQRLLHCLYHAASNVLQNHTNGYKQCHRLGNQHKKPTERCKPNKACSTIEEVSPHGSCCTSRHPTIRNKPNTTHAPLRKSSPKTARLKATRSAKRPSKHQKARDSPQNAPHDATNTSSVLIHLIILHRPETRKQTVS
jgi:hypothetical protein